jgi:hypothetical protein
MINIYLTPTRHASEAKEAAQAIVTNVLISLVRVNPLTAYINQGSLIG